MSSALVFVRSSHMQLYDGQPLERGEVFRMRNQANDAKLIRYNYVEELDEESLKHISKCISCGREFADDSYKRSHSNRARHEAVDLDKPNLKAPPRPIQNPDPDGNGEWGLETQGSPAPPPLEKTGVVGGRRESTARGQREMVPFT